MISFQCSLLQQETQLKVYMDNSLEEPRASKVILLFQYLIVVAGLWNCMLCNPLVLKTVFLEERHINNASLAYTTCIIGPLPNSEDIPNLGDPETYTG